MPGLLVEQVSQVRSPDLVRTTVRLIFFTSAAVFADSVRIGSLVYVIPGTFAVPEIWICFDHQHSPNQRRLANQQRAARSIGFITGNSCQGMPQSFHSMRHLSSLGWQW